MNSLSIVHKVYHIGGTRDRRDNSLRVIMASPDIATLAQHACFLLRLNAANIHYLNSTCKLINSAAYLWNPCNSSIVVVRFVVGVTISDAATLFIDFDTSQMTLKH